MLSILIIILFFPNHAILIYSYYVLILVAYDFHSVLLVSLLGVGTTESADFW